MVILLHLNAAPIKQKTIIGRTLCDATKRLTDPLTNILVTQSQD